MRKCMILLAAMAVLCCGCGTVIDQTAAVVSEPEMTAPALEDVSMPEASEEELTAPPLDEIAEQEATAVLEAPEAPVAAEAPEAPADLETPEAPAPEENRDADFAWFGRGVYEARIDGTRTGEYYLFNGNNSGTLLTPGFTYSFTCEQTKLDVAFYMNGSEEATIYAMSGPDANGDLIGDIGEVRYTFTLLPVDLEEFSLEGWEQTHQEE